MLKILDTPIYLKGMKPWFDNHHQSQRMRPSSSHHQRRNNRWNCGWSELSNLEKFRRFIWCTALLTLFCMERRRTYVRNQKDLTATRVLMGIMFEVPEDKMTHRKRVPKSFLPVHTGIEDFDGTQACKHMPEDNRCRAYLPFVDLREYRRENGKPGQRLMQTHDLSQVGERYAVLTERGIGINHEEGNQDRSFIIAPFHPFDKPSSSTDDFLMCVMDGHGEKGQHIAEAAMGALPLALTKELNKARRSVANSEIHKLMTEIMIKTFQKLDKKVPDELTSGTTISVSFKLGNYIHIANTGDSRTFLVMHHPHDDITKIYYTTRSHTADNPEERSRILASGGSLWVPPMSPRGIQPPTRVYLEVVEDETNNFTSTYALATSRSIGDRAAKEIGVVPDPSVATANLDVFRKNHPGYELFVVAATDGLVDKIAPLTVVERVAASFYRNDTVSPLQTIEGIILDANEVWTKSRTMVDGQVEFYRDDMTIAIAKVT